ncbi:WLM domain-containing protein [Pyronema omphalodes]|nr:WLM domain-containing protein [Pyronema omphalodes]
MPLGIERINVRRRSPNALINFITPLQGPDKEIAQDYLERIAAIVYPIMKEHNLAVMTLDEFPPNKEFWGRNFNAGGTIQLVLKHPNTGQWLPFKFVQGVMIHELAHIKQMNHSSAFWAVRNKYARELDALHARGYTGEGFWSAGRSLLSEQYTQDRPLAESEMPKQICGGTYRSRNRRRHAQSVEKLSSAEQKKRRIERKMSPYGPARALTAEDSPASDGKPKPRVAQSKRGRELRAAAALKRFEQKKEEESINDPKVEEEEASSNDEDEKVVNVGGGKFLVPVSAEQDTTCDTEDNQHRELLELLGEDVCGFSGRHGEPASRERQEDTNNKTKHPPKIDQPSKSSPYQTPTLAPGRKVQKRELPPTVLPSNHTADRHTATNSLKPSGNNDPPTSKSTNSTITVVDLSETESCPICSYENQENAPTCAACMNVLIPSDSAWKCSNTSACHPEYRNSKDVVFCGICSSRRSA